MKGKFPLIVAISALFATTASAEDWTGFYAGASLGHVSGKNSYVFDGGGIDDYDLESGGFGGIHAGYRWDFGSNVMGAELSYSRLTTREEDWADYRYDGLLDLKVSLGYELFSPSSLVYLNLGASKIRYDWPGDSLTATGPLLGIGYVHAITDRLSVGAEMNYRRLKNDSSGIEGAEEFISRTRTFEVRVNYRF